MVCSAVALNVEQSGASWLLLCLTRSCFFTLLPRGRAHSACHAHPKISKVVKNVGLGVPNLVFW